MRRIGSLLALMAVAICAAFAAIAAPKHNTHHVVDRWRVGGPGGWDYLTFDPASRRLFISRSDRVVVLDGDSGKPLGEIAGTAGVHGIALAPALHRGFTSNGKSDSVSVFDTDTLAPIETIKIEGKVPDAILYDPASQRVFTFNARSADTTVIDAASGKVIGAIALGGKPEFAVADGHGRVFVNIEDTSRLAVIDARAAKQVDNWALSDCTDPTGLALDEAHHRLFAVCQNNKMLVLDSKSGKRVADLPIGAGPDGAAFDPEYGLAFSSNGSDGTLSIVHEDDPTHFRVVATVETQKSARTIALDPKTHRVFLPAAEFTPAPAPTAEQPKPRPVLVPDSFTIVVVGE